MRPIRIQIVIPPEWREAFNEQMRRDGYNSLSRWGGESMVAQLDKDLRENLPALQKRGRPKNTGATNEADSVNAGS